MDIESANISAEICCFLLLLIFLAAILLKRSKSRSLLCISLIFIGESIAVITDVIFRLSDAAQATSAALYIDYIISFTASVFMVSSFYWYFLALFEEKGIEPFSRRRRRWISFYSGFIILLFASSVWTGWFFYMPPDGKIGYTEYFYWVFLLMLPMAIADFILLWKYRALTGLKETAILYIFCTAVLIGAAYDMKHSTVVTHVFLTLFAALLYILVDVKQERRLISIEKELAEAELSSMISQINPHFIHNTLSSIYALGLEEPEQSRELISAFSDYLCDYYSDLTHEPLIPFSEELRHVRHYLYIESVRFPNLTVNYDIDADDFSIPSLTVQPLVENAVNHGICRRRKSAGNITVASSENASSYVVTVKDDGVGFDTTQAPKDGRLHIGIENVRKRLALLCGGELDIESRKDCGTVCRITIPKEME